jgi:hypothetical protein
MAKQLDGFIGATMTKPVGRALESAVLAHNEGAGSIESRLLITGRELGRLGIAGAQELESPGRVERPVRGLPEERDSERPRREAA